MAFRPGNLSLVGPLGRECSLWHYRTGDRPAEVVAKGYFDPAAPQLRYGDRILVHAGFDHFDVAVTYRSDTSARVSQVGLTEAGDG